MYTHILSQDLYMQHLVGAYTQGEVKSIASQAYMLTMLVRTYMNTVVHVYTSVLRMYVPVFAYVRSCTCAMAVLSLLACARQGSHVPAKWLSPTMHIGLTVPYGCSSSQLIPVGVFEHSTSVQSLCLVGKPSLCTS